MGRSYSLVMLEADNANLEIIERTLRGRNRGFYSEGVILLDRRIESSTEKACIIAEELGHYHTTAGIIIDQSNTQNRKQELRAREWGYEFLVPLSGIVEAYYAGVSDKHDLAEFLDVTEVYLADALDRYRDKYGIFYNVDRFTIYFDPLQVIEIFD